VLIDTAQSINYMSNEHHSTLRPFNSHPWTSLFSNTLYAPITTTIRQLYEEPPNTTSLIRQAGTYTITSNILHTHRSTLNMPRILRSIFVALAAAQIALGHSWIEQMRNIDDKGNYVGQYGYARGMYAKTDLGYTGNSMNFLLPRPDSGSPFINDKTPLCHPSQTKQVQSQPKYPRLQAVPGGFIAMRYMENGHVSLIHDEPNINKPEKGGTVFVYGTTEPKEDEKLISVLLWTEDGQGGDKRGKLLAMENYDDNRCYEINAGPISKERSKSDPNFASGQVSNGPGNYPLFCETDVQLPKDAQVGKPYTFYWVWQWNTAPGGAIPGGKDEYYTTCIDVDVTSADVASAADVAGVDKKFALGQQDAMSVAVKDFASRTAIITDIKQAERGPIFSGNATNSLPTPTGSLGGASGGGQASSGAPAPSPAVTSGAVPPKFSHISKSSASASVSIPVSSAQAPVSSKAPAASQAPASGPSGIPTLTGRPGAAPSSVAIAPSIATPSPIVASSSIAGISGSAGGDGVVTITDIVLITVTGSVSTPTPSAVVTSKRGLSSLVVLTTLKSQASPAVTSHASKATPTAAPQSPPAAAPSQLSGFSMRNKNGAKFRRMYE
jgi:hypothetical protein